MLVVGGTFDAEDCYGAWNLYKAVLRQTDNYLFFSELQVFFHSVRSAIRNSFLVHISGLFLRIIITKKLSFAANLNLRHPLLFALIKMHSGIFTGLPL